MSIKVVNTLLKKPNFFFKSDPTFIDIFRKNRQKIEKMKILIIDQIYNFMDRIDFMWYLHEN